MAQKELWFKSKKSGWSWGIPQHRNGWYAYGIFTAVWLAALVWLSTSVTVDGISSVGVTIFTIVVLADCVGLVYVSYKYGDMPTLQKGKKHGTTKS